MSNFITHNLSRLANFRGRDTRAQFWPYVGVVFAATMLVYFVAFSALMVSLTAKMHTYALAHPDHATVISGLGHYSVSIEGNPPEIAEPFTDMTTTILGATGVMGVVFVLLYGAAVVRRLHDRSLSGWWGLMPLPFLTFGLIAMSKLFADFTEPTAFNLGLFALMFINIMIYNGLLIFLIVLLAKRSDPSINRYGPPIKT